MLTWDYEAQTCDISLPGYIERALQRFQHTPPEKPEHAPHKWCKPVFGQKKQMAVVNESPLFDAANKKQVQEVLGTLLFYARAVDSTMLTAINAIAAQQAHSTKMTMKAVTK